MRPLTRVRSGDPLSATQQNRIIDRVNELGRLGNNERGLALFEATADLTYADPLDATAPHCTAKRLYYNAVNRDRQGDYTKAVDTVYMSIADWDGSAYLGTVHIEEGDRFWAVWDSQAGRWEVVMQEVGGERWGTLDADLAYNDPVGVTVSILETDLSGDSGVNIENVLAPWTMQSGTIPSGTRVLIRKIGGSWFVVLAPCDEEE